MDRASVSEAEGHWFESSIARQFIPPKTDASSEAGQPGRVAFPGIGSKGVAKPIRGSADPGRVHSVSLPPTARQNGQNRRASHLKAVSDPRPIVLSILEVANLLGICRASAYKLIEGGELPAARIGSLLRVHRVDLDAYLARKSGGRSR